MKPLPPMSAHTAAKHLLLRRYLDAWFPILGSRHRSLIYIDGFSGAGEYADGQVGSPIIALRCALEHIEKGSLRPESNVHFFFVEADQYNCSHLREYLGSMALRDCLHIEVVAAPFSEFLKKFLARPEFRRIPTFAFVDPFGFSGIPFALTSSILSRPRCELFINIMVSFINRFLAHPNDRVVSHFPETFGTDEVLDIPGASGDREEAILLLYRRQLAKKAHYVGRFNIRNRRERSIYSLFFATNSDKGFLKMKEAMWSVDKAAGWQFSDSDPHGFFSFDLFGTEPLRWELQDHFRGRTVSWSDVERFTIRQTDFLPKHAREQLRTLEDQGKIEVRALAGYKRRAGTYPDGKMTISFP